MSNTNIESAESPAPTDTPLPAATARVARLRRRSWTSLWANRDFLKLWSAETISDFGSQVTLLALPLAAVLSLHAGAAQMGFLGAAGTAPFLLFSLLAGAWIDRLRRRPLMIAADLGRAGLLLLIPLAWAAHLLRIELLYAVAFLHGSLSVIDDVSYVAFLPALVGRDQLMEANGKLRGSTSLAQVSGPGLAGVLIGAVSAPFAIIADAVSFVVSALLIGRIKAEEPARPLPQARRPVHREIGDGLKIVFGNAVLRAMTGAGATTEFFAYIFFAVYVLYMSDDVGLGPSAIGLVFAAGGIGALIGALLAEPTSRRFGLGPTVVWSRLGFGLGSIPLLLAFVAPSWALPLLVGSEFVSWLMVTISNVNQLTVRMAMVPDRLLGRVTATIRFAGTGFQPLGSLAGGLLGALLGIRFALTIGIVGMALAFTWVLWSPVRGLTEPPRSL